MVVKMEVDLSYVSLEDRISLCIRRQGDAEHWWLTRRLALRWLQGWADKLAAVPLPAAPQSLWTPGGGPQTTAEQHALLMEVDPPRVQTTAASPSPAAGSSGRLRLLHSVSLSVSQTSCTVTLLAQEHRLALVLTRHEAHSLLEALVQAVKGSGWLEAVPLPDWLGWSENRADDFAAVRGGV